MADSRAPLYNRVIVIASKTGCTFSSAFASESEILEMVRESKRWQDI